MGLLTSLRAKYELYRLEQRYTRREKRTTFISGAHYVDGEYVYNVSALGAKSPPPPAAGKGRMSVVNVKELFPSTSGVKRTSRAWY
ncbi:UbiH, 2-polyprenyl-6-methoxyphenol hydroxylase [Teratosphaeria destructans]|uniref:UbiH, 2-polyprenyl-6-methoxyphenol hydroxylase n=1 Tax=Teratosphaeria destructans TaxID=418781 RepID=A0A9W7STI9_9PEZI|nr:UbiH, 2-polyprenyl-6-methoxyphenol hydroxylase [Teratosphaeria destructans]